MPSDFLYLPDRGCSPTVSTRTKSAMFGDGYEQTVGDGLNVVKETWNLNFTLRTMTEVNAIDDFLRARYGALSFTWTNPRGIEKRYRCKEWSPVYEHGTMGAISATFVEAFEP